MDFFLYIHIFLSFHFHWLSIFNNLITAAIAATNEDDHNKNNNNSNKNNNKNKITIILPPKSKQPNYRTDKKKNRHTLKHFQKFEMQKRNGQQAINK